jgi:hypothetical protein
MTTRGRALAVASSARALVPAVTLVITPYEGARAEAGDDDAILLDVDDVASEPLALADALAKALRSGRWAEAGYRVGARPQCQSDVSQRASPQRGLTFATVACRPSIQGERKGFDGPRAIQSSLDIQWRSSDHSNRVRSSTPRANGGLVRPPPPRESFDVLVSVAVLRQAPRGRRRAALPRVASSVGGHNARSKASRIPRRVFPVRRRSSGPTFRSRRLKNLRSRCSIRFSNLRPLGLRQTRTERR